MQGSWRKELEIVWNHFMELERYIMLRASEVGSPTNHLGSRQQSQGSSSPLDTVNLVINYQKWKNTDRLLDPFY